MDSKRKKSRIWIKPSWKAVIRQTIYFLQIWLTMVSDKTSGKHNLKVAILPANLNTCSIDDFACLTMAANDRLGMEAIKSLHQKLDDDANGNVDLTESDDVRTSRSVFSYLLIVFIVFKRRTQIQFGLWASSKSFSLQWRYAYFCKRTMGCMAKIGSAQLDGWTNHRMAYYFSWFTPICS